MELRTPGVDPEMERVILDYIESGEIDMMLKSLKQSQLEQTQTIIEEMGLDDSDVETTKKLIQIINEEVDVSEVKFKIIAVLAKHFTKEDLVALTKFNRSPLARRAREASLTMLPELTEVSGEWAIQTMKRLKDRLDLLDLEL